MSATTQQIPFDQLTPRARAVWAQGDFARAGAEQVIVGELLTRAVDIHPGQSVLDVAAGSGNAAREQPSADPAATTRSDLRFRGKGSAPRFVPHRPASWRALAAR